MTKYISAVSYIACQQDNSLPNRGKNLHVQDYFFYTAIPPGFIQPKEINNGEMAPYAELKISKRTFKELPFPSLFYRKRKIPLRTLYWEWSNVGQQRILCNLKQSCIQYTRPILFLYVFSPSCVFRCLERLPRMLHQFSNLTSNSLACENIRFSSLFATRAISRETRRNGCFRRLLIHIIWDV